jgi:hypothetical protein
MTDVDLPAHWVQSGLLGPLCARHGVPSDRAIKRKFATATPTWVYLLLVTGLLLPAIIQAVLRKTLQGNIPGCQRCPGERRRALAAGWGMFALVAVLLVLSLASSSGALFALSCVALLGALVGVIFVQRQRVVGILSRDGQSVTLKGVDQRFADGARAALVVPAAQPGGFTRLF